jgi:cysteine-rich repeat protein
MVPRIVEPACGDRQVNGFEQCDDGNRRSLDGCDGFCRFEPSHQYALLAEPGPPAPVPSEVVTLRHWRPRTVAPADDEGILVLPLPFPFYFYGRWYHGLVIHTNGFVSLLPDFDMAAFDSASPLGPSAPNAVISLFGADLIAPQGSAETIAWTEGQRFSIELRNYEPKDEPGSQVTGRITLYENGRIRLDYLRLDADGPFQIGVESPSGNSIFIHPACEQGCNGEVLSIIGAVELVPGG